MQSSFSNAYQKLKLHVADEANSGHEQEALTFYMELFDELL